MRLGIIIMLLVALAPVRARADVESEQVKAGVAAYDDLDYAKAVDLLHKALNETLTREERVVTWRTLAFAHVALNKPDDARADFESLLRVDPSYQPDRTISPRVRKVFEDAKAHVATEGTPTDAEHRMPSVQPVITPKVLKAGKPVTFALTYPGGVAQKLELFYRTRGQLRFSRVEVAGKQGVFEVTIPGLQVGGPALEWYLVLLDDGGLAIANAGSLGQPLGLDVLSRPVPVYKKGWFWGVVVGVAAAGALAAGLAVGLQPAKIGPDTPAALTIHPN
jgi:hypothetical protein